ncbi:hypothetical protein HZH68_007342 [Vespula germanica]|uniref:K Homology domain-containing protein n=1 Tax=Vespula germanica TaxID=30212 RepID=A0A834N9V0_VESGE|nr:hypothetical protein HZH68_007342 [Vespula germanica]
MSATRICNKECRDPFKNLKVTFTGYSKDIAKSNNYDYDVYSLTPYKIRLKHFLGFLILRKIIIVLTISSDLTTVLQVLNEVVPNLEENGSRHGSDEIDVRMLVHQSQAGCVIGKGGLKIKELREGGFRKTITRPTAKRGLACSEICNVAKWLVTFSRLRETKPNTANPSTRFVIEVSLKKCHYVAILCLSTLKN